MQVHRGLLVYTLHVYRPGLKCTEVKSRVCLGQTKISRSEAGTPCPHWAWKTCSRDGSLLSPKRPRTIRLSSLLLLIRQTGVLFPKVWAGEGSKGRGPEGPHREVAGSRVWSAVKPVSHPGQMVSEVTVLKPLPHYWILLSQEFQGNTVV